MQWGGFNGGAQAPEMRRERLQRGGLAGNAGSSFNPIVDPMSTPTSPYTEGQPEGQQQMFFGRRRGNGLDWDAIMGSNGMGGRM